MTNRHRKVMPADFQPDMVRALLREADAPGTGKSMTRRTLYRLRRAKDGLTPAATELAGYPRCTTAAGWLNHAVGEYWTLEPSWHKLAPGDLLYVREAIEAFNSSLLAALGLEDEPMTLDRSKGNVAARYRADKEECLDPWARHGDGADLAWKWKPDSLPARYCPRSFSRLTLTVTASRIERLHAITDADCIAEGAELDARPSQVDGGPMVRVTDHVIGTPRAWYRQLWDRINGAGAWDANPWVVVTSFTVARGNIDVLLAGEVA